MNKKQAITAIPLMPERWAVEAAGAEDKSVNYMWHRGGFGRGMPHGMPRRMPPGRFIPPMGMRRGYFRRGCFLPGCALPAILIGLLVVTALAVLL